MSRSRRTRSNSRSGPSPGSARKSNNTDTSSPFPTSWFARSVLIRLYQHPRRVQYSRSRKDILGKYQPKAARLSLFRQPKTPRLPDIILTPPRRRRRQCCIPSSSSSSSSTPRSLSQTGARSVIYTFCSNTANEHVVDNRLKMRTSLGPSEAPGSAA